MNGPSPGSRLPRVAFLRNPLSGYADASLRAFADTGAEMLVFHQGVERDPNAPFDPFPIEERVPSYRWSGVAPLEQIRSTLEELQPDALVIASWNNGVYRRVAREWRGRAVRIMTMDNMWLGTAKQWAGLAVSRFVVHPMADAIFLCGEPQARFARKLGFSTERQMHGFYTGDHPLFSAVAERRGPVLPPEAFLYVGRLIPVKAIDVLAAAYARYRDEVADPWPLLIAGTGPHEELLAGAAGVKLLGFTQPEDLPAVVERAGCLVLPSRFEPWAVVIHEAAAAGLPVVCTDACGAASRLVLDGYNGYVVPKDDVAALSAAFGRIHSASDERRLAMGRASEELARQYTPERWAETLLTGIADHRRRLGLDRPGGQRPASAPPSSGPRARR